MEKKIKELIKNILTYMNNEIYVTYNTIIDNDEDKSEYILKSFYTEDTSNQFTIKLSKTNFSIDYNRPNNSYTCFSVSLFGDDIKYDIKYDEKVIDIKTGSFGFDINDSVFNMYEKELKMMCEEYESKKFDSLINNIYRDFKKERKIKIDQILGD